MQQVDCHHSKRLDCRKKWQLTVGKASHFRNDLKDASDDTRSYFSFCQDEISALRRRLEKSEKERNELRQTADSLETKVCAATNTHARTQT